MTGAVAAEEWEDVAPHAGPQSDFLSTPADIAIYGGAAGGGKTWALIAEPLRHIELRSFNAVTFRRTSVQVRNAGSLWDESWKIYPQLGGVAKQSTLEWEFDSGARVKFAHMEHEATKLDWQGSAIALILWDELTHFTESQFWYFLSRNRSTCGIRPYIRATTNPDADSWVATLVAWWIDQETGYPILNRAGVLRWFVRVDDVLVWGDSAEELRRRHPGLLPKSLTFIPAKLEDNPALERLDPGYRANLMALPTVERERLLGGNWKVRLTGGMFFRAGSIGVLDYEPTVTRVVRGWDLASLEGSGDWTAGLKMGLQNNGRYVILDLIAGQWETGGRDARIKQAADMDGLSVHQRLPQDPGQAGKSQVAHFARMLNGCNWSSGPVIGNKATRATRFAAAVNSGQVDMVRADWNKRLLDRLDRFPDSSVPDDEVDACSDAFNTILDGCWVSDETETSAVSA
ncbi:Archaeophage PsiM2, terminase large subunit [uncultured Caudovirales phage]|uniref:Archaeophage PsiM2, terminase large subunit n=1 Tax=uncultured Caudovirales phage TaxID=2100421 RepID=A0A6J5RE23_9CAUD|nr:Archaeophage PsiM2, terminase large subunit [uncultured Caudovirales phage]CAB4180518.1 Archaeophage PsiM2, terminase large subunit [uncultured Caudovirales phage]CAB4190715.1 Archaeophage PsiM2, terminase large subunit [uncultured Caudovirales phage]CAB4221855.1 Archaeophage PsiM2, terminase large subunit [uncultured Caudovirales phage]